MPALYASYQQGQGSGSWFIEDSSNTVIVSVMVEEKGRQTADKKEGRKPWTLREFGGQTVWDWLHLLSALAIPVVLAAAGLWFTAQQDQRQQDIEGQRAKQAQKIEDQRAKAERALAEQRAQDEALQAYLTQMSTLLLEKDLRESPEDSEVRILARARTLTALKRLDSERNNDILQFLREAQLITGTDPVISLNNANLRGAHLRNADLSDAVLSGAYLRDAHLRDASLSETDLSFAIMSGADMSWVDLIKADLSSAYLFKADLSDAHLNQADLSDAVLSGANLSDAELNKANLSNAELVDANLSGAYLIDANLSGANLSGNLGEANLNGANLSGANLSRAEGITNEELDQQAASLEEATMPNGQKYEDWLKDKKAQGKDEKNE